MSETATKADVERLRKDFTKGLRILRQDLTRDVREVRKELCAMEKRVDGRLDEVDQRLGAKIDGVATDVRHVKVDLESVKDHVKKIAEVVVSIDAKLDRHLARNDAEHARLERATLSGDAALDRRVTALEKHAGI